MGLLEKYWGFGIVGGGGGGGIKTIHSPITWKWYEVRSEVLPSESPACFFVLSMNLMLQTQMCKE